MPDFSRYAPDFKLEIDGQPIPAALRGAITSINYQTGLEGADRVEVALANENLRWLDHPLLQIDNGFTLSLGYAPQPLEKMFVGEITGVNATFPSGGIPTLTIVAHDFLQRLTTGTKDRAFKVTLPCIGEFPLPDPLVVSAVTATNLLIPFPDPVGSALSFLTLLVSYAIDPLEAKRGTRVQERQSDFDFLTQIASANGWEMHIDHTLEPKGYVLRFRFLVQDYTPSVSLTYGHSLIDFTPRITNVGQIANVTARIWVAALQMEFVIVLGWDFDRAAFDLMVYPGFGPLEDLVGSERAQNTLVVDAGGPATVPGKLLSELLPRLNNRLTGSGSTIGNTKIRAGSVINLDGVGAQFGGLHRVTSATHSLDSGGYRTQFEVRKEVWFGSIPLPKGPEGLLRLQGQRL